MAAVSQTARDYLLAHCYVSAANIRVIYRSTTDNDFLGATLEIPLGIFVSETVALVREAGFGKAVTTDEGIDGAF